jgi:hypothetical protein
MISPEKAAAAIAIITINDVLFGELHTAASLSIYFLLYLSN